MIDTDKQATNAAQAECCPAYWFAGDAHCGLKAGHEQPHHGAAGGHRFKWARLHPRPRDLIREV